MDTFTAVGLVEGFIEPEFEDPESEILTAWQHLIDTGTVWSLQGWFGRAAAALIEAGVCTAREVH
jgi:hypothetical protein